MVQNIIVKILLAPFSILYGIGVSIRNFFYQRELLKGISFNLPVISVGNLTVGGAGKTPHIEYLIRYLKDYIEVATLSRGYKRKSKGFLMVQANNDANLVGDEPLQFKRKFPDIAVSVAENRTFAIPEILMNHPNTQTILLDDAFQHRAIKPGLNILLTDYNMPFTRDYLMPSGRLREWRSGYERADIIIVSKCPFQLDTTEAEKLKEEINPFPHQQIYFSYYTYHNPYYILNPRYQIKFQADWDILLICAIARADYLVEYLEEQVNSIHVLEYEDHRYFSKYDVSNLKTTFDNMPSEKKLILTTEKDAMRLELHKDYLVENKLPIFAIPVQVDFHFNQHLQFNEDVQNFLLNFKS